MKVANHKALMVVNFWFFENYNLLSRLVERGFITESTFIMVGKKILSQKWKLKAVHVLLKMVKDDFPKANFTYSSLAKVEDSIGLVSFAGSVRFYLLFVSAFLICVFVLVAEIHFGKM